MGTINVLIVEDEPLITDLLKQIFKQLSEDHDKDFKLHIALDCDAAIQKIEQAVLGKPFDLALVDVNIPASKDMHILSGEDIAMELRNYFNKIKIIIYTSNNDNYRLNNILHTINPDGFLIKSDIGYKTLVEAIMKVVDSPPYYSNTILNLIRKHISSDFVIDNIDRLLLYELSKGTRTKDLPNFVNLSKGGVEKRKRHLKEVFDVEGKGDKRLIQIAKEKGYI
ncbi:response regulator [Snuella lapsa]|uniref:Response regulatory domain-containing protein n=1 Tax=Snuella lapsa TaxID=870481 RepID=A0ABP6WP99_9FLAO